MKSKKLLIAAAAAAVVILGIAAAVLFAPKENPGTTVVVETNQTEYRVGDTVTCTVKLKPVTDLVGLKFMLELPEGLTYVDGTGKAPEDLQKTMNAVKAEFVEQSKVFIFLGESAYENEEDTVLLTMDCIVSEKAAATQSVGFVMDELECFNMENEDIDCTVTGAEVRVTDAA